ncbi:glycosyltransferase involved in cell wall biosynthesis [Blastococcus colisei]|uniref:Glycosyltransferase involved in cell wall biosynthesis n=1 Tax=Blastococcus colisei TaxID=1564162 RepID=A0A543P040_9ACTN|nr:glycosyltransferase [Blastococcus colisei]TQN37465.1 glycosyltransferase involved in cell wall biosynthesis [Blastococcus colisei]
MHRPPDHSPGVIAENRRHYELLVEMARHYAGQGDVEHTLRAAMLAGNYAWLAPVGLLSDLRLERTVVRAVRGSGRVEVDGERRRGRILHVLSEAYSIGGHTRLVWRWMNLDERTSDVVLTNQLGPVPDRLVESVRDAGGDLHDLRSTAHDLLDRARALRQHMDRADLVVLHVHPYDAVALAAVNLPGVRPPVVYENHADLSFWLGVAGADLLCDLRTHARELDVELRRVPDARIGVLPMPVEAMTSSPGDALRRELGIRPDAVVALTVSDNWKVAACWGRGMHHVLDRVLHWSPQLSFVLVGVTPDANWDRLSKRYPGRVFVVGRVPDSAPYFALGDIYLESYPTRAGTTPLEAAMLGLPVVALADAPEGDPARIFQTCSPGLDERPVATTPEQFAVAVRRLAVDPELRRSEGADARAGVLAVHDGSGWRSRLESLYEQARSLPAGSIDELGDSPTDDRYGALLLSAFSPAPASPDPRRMAGPLGTLFDATMESDLSAALIREVDSPILARVAQGWQDHPAWTSRLLALAAVHPRLRVSLPFVADDDVQGTRSVACLTALLADVGQTPDDCGDIGLESHAPHSTVTVPGELTPTDEALDRVERLVSSPLLGGVLSATAHAQELQPLAV